MQIVITGNKVGASAHTYETSDGKIRHIILNPPDKSYELITTSSYPYVRSCSFLFSENGNPCAEEDQETTFIICAETIEEAAQLTRLRFSLVDQGQWWIMFVEGSLLNESILHSQTV